MSSGVSSGDGKGRGGAGPGARLLLLHGMDGVGAVWRKMIERLDPSVRAGALAPDLGGHGQGPRLETYDLEQLAGDVFERLGSELSQGRWVIAGHSLGGAVGLTLAAMHPELEVGHVLASSCKTVWTDEDLAMGARVAQRPVQFFEDEEAAMARFLRVSGLDGLADPELARAGIVADEAGWRLAVDPPVHQLDPGNFAALLESVPVPVLLITGEQDQMAPPADLARFDRPLRVVPGAGHNLHVQAPDRFAELVTEHLG